MESSGAVTTIVLQIQHFDKRQARRARRRITRFVGVCPLCDGVVGYFGRRARARGVTRLSAYWLPGSIHVCSKKGSR